MCFTVQGWMRAPDRPQSPRTPMPPMDIQAPNAFVAAERYAEHYRIKTEFWNDGTATPPIVIRVSR